MKVLYNKRFSFILTFALHYVILDFIWTEMENAIYGHTMPSTEDSMILILPGYRDIYFMEGRKQSYRVVRKPRF